LTGPPQPLILGVEFLREMNASICLIMNALSLAQNMIIPLRQNMKSTHKLHQIANIKSTHNLKLEPRQESSIRRWEKIFREIPGSIFSLPSNIAWAFTSSTTPSKDRGVGKAIRNHLAEKETGKISLGSTTSFRKGNRHVLQIAIIGNNGVYTPAQTLKNCCTKLKEWTVRNGISDIAIPRSTCRTPCRTL